MLGRVIVLVRDDQLPLAIGRKGQNVRLASKLVGWDIEVMTQTELDQQLDKTVEAFSSIPGVSEELAESLVSQGFFSYYDLSVIEPDQLAELGGLTAEQCEQIVEVADRESERVEAEEDAMRSAKKTHPGASAAKPATENLVEEVAEPAVADLEEAATALEEDAVTAEEDTVAVEEDTTDSEEAIGSQEVPVNAENATEESTEKQE
jgi:transcription termination/antitermination protein NusA